MPDINVQFHVTPDELSEWIREWSRFGDIHMVAMRFPPVAFKRIAIDEVPKIVRDTSVSRISLLLSPFDEAIRYQSDFDNTYDHQLIIQIGRLTPDGLGESRLSARTDNAEAINLWMRIAKNLKARTSHGLTAINRQTGERGFYQKHRYSQGAKALDDKGVPIISIVGPGKGPILRLGKRLSNE